MRPIRDNIKEESLILMGVPRRFCNLTLDDFMVKEKGLDKVKNKIKDYIDNIESNMGEGKGIFFYGSNGVGKSMLSCIVLKEFYRNRYSCRRITFAQYINAYTTSWGKKDREIYEQDLYSKYKGVDFLVIEEVGKEVESKIAKPILEDLLRYREEKGYVTFICCNLTLEDFREYYGSSICSLVNGNQTIIKIVGEDKRKALL